MRNIYACRYGAIKKIKEDIKLVNLETKEELEKSIKLIIRKEMIKYFGGFCEEELEDSLCSISQKIFSKSKKIVAGAMNKLSKDFIERVESEKISCNLLFFNSKRNVSILKMCFSSPNEKKSSLSKISKEFGLTRERIRQIKYSCIKRCIDFMELASKVLNNDKEEDKGSDRKHKDDVSV